MEANKIMVVLADRAWTTQALHLACAMARRQNILVILVKMIPVVHPQILGTTAGYLQLTAQEERDIQEYAATAEDYGVAFTIQFCQYANYLHGIVDAAQQLGPRDVLAHIPDGRFVWWQRLQEWWLDKRLSHQKHCLHTLAEGSNPLEWIPTVVLSHPKTFR